MFPTLVYNIVIFFKFNYIKKKNLTELMMKPPRRNVSSLQQTARDYLKIKINFIRAQNTEFVYKIRLT